MPSFEEITELQQQNDLDIAMGKAGYPKNKLNALVKVVQEQITLNAKERKERNTLQDLQDKTQKIRAQQTQKLLKLEQEGENTNTMIKKVSKMINNYEATNVHHKRLNELLDVHKRDNKQIKHASDGILGTVYTNNRRVEYQEPELEWLAKVRILIIIVYYTGILFVVVKVLLKG